LTSEPEGHCVDAPNQFIGWAQGTNNPDNERTFKGLIPAFFYIYFLGCGTAWGGHFFCKEEISRVQFSGDPLPK